MCNAGTSRRWEVVRSWVGWVGGVVKGGTEASTFALFFSARQGIATKKHTTRLQHFVHPFRRVPQLLYSIPIKPYQTE